jgi:aldose 1-epimerase
MIPTGVVQPVDDTTFDFRHARQIASDGSVAKPDYDVNFCLSAARGPLRQAAWVQGASSGVEMELWTTEPGLQLYIGQHVSPPGPGIDGIGYRPFSGFCLEPQIWPDAPNRPYFPQATLWPGAVYHHVTEYRFRLP